MARIYERTGKKGTYWYLDYNLEGQRVRKRVGQSKKLAELALADVQVKLERKELGFAAKDRPLSDFIDEYLVYSKANKAPETCQRDAITLGYLKDFIRGDRLSSITAHQLEGYKAWRKEAGKEPSTINRELNTIKALLNKAVAWGALSQNPAKGVSKFKEPRGQVRFLSTKEIQALLKTVEGGNRYAMTETLLNTGIRRGELVWLDWPDLDFNRKIVAIQAKEGWQPKDYEVRHIPMTPHLFKVLSGLPRKDRGPVFVNGDGQRFNPDVLTHDFEDIMAQAKISDAGIHTLRHTFASHLVMKGVDLYTVQKLLGHASIKTTEIYAHLAPDYLRSAMNRLRY